MQRAGSKSRDDQLGEQLETQQGSLAPQRPFFEPPIDPSRRGSGLSLPLPPCETTGQRGSK